LNKREYKRNRKNFSWFENEITELKQALQVNDDLLNNFIKKEKL
jgi:hypothetical protein